MKHGKKILAGAMALMVALMAVGCSAPATECPEVKECPEPEVKEVEVPVEVPVEVEVIKEVEKIVEVDNGNLKLVLEEIYDNDGAVDYLTEDLDDDELDKIVDRIVFVNDIKLYAVEAVDKEGIDELDKEMVNETMIDEDDVERFKIYDDADEIRVEDVDYEDKDATVYVDVKFEQDEVDYKATFKVKIRDDAVDKVSVESVELRE